MESIESRNAIAAIVETAIGDENRAKSRWMASAPDFDPLEEWGRRFAVAGRLTLNFHPDRRGRDGRTVAAGLAGDGTYSSQWITGISAGSRSALHGGDRNRFEHKYFAGAYDDAVPSSGLHPVYGALDLLYDEHGGAPRFGSSYVVLKSHVRERTTLSAGDSHANPTDVGTFGYPWSILASLSEQAAHANLLNRHLDVHALEAALRGGYRSERASRDLDGYIEAQVHGVVSLADDVEAIVLDPSFRGDDVEYEIAAAAAQFGFYVEWHRGTELAVHDVPDDFRGATMPALARKVAGANGVLNARAIGAAMASEPFVKQNLLGDSPESNLQQLKYLWHTLLAFGDDAVS